MKLTKTSWAILAIGIFVIAFGSLGAARSQQLSEGKQLSEELAMAELRLSRLDLTDLSTKQDSLQQQINQASQQLETAKTRLTQPNDSITISDAVFNIARASSVEVAHIGSSGLSRSNLNKIGGSSLPISVSVKGELPSLIDFIMRLNTELPTGIVKSAQISIGKAPDSATDNATQNDVINVTVTATNEVTVSVGDNVTDSGTLPVANVQLEVYSYKGS